VYVCVCVFCALFSPLSDVSESQGKDASTIGAVSALLCSYTCTDLPLPKSSSKGDSSATGGGLSFFSCTLRSQSDGQFRMEIVNSVAQRISYLEIWRAALNPLLSSGLSRNFEALSLIG
jgi:hypothetical protein